MGVIWTSAAITIEVALSFLGLGRQSAYPESGGLFFKTTCGYLLCSRPLLFGRVIALAWTVQALNLMGDRFRDVLVPKMR